MADPWDPLPLPLLGDQDDGVLFEALGRAIDRWEYVEFGLSQMFSLFTGAETWQKMREYGSNGNIFRDRLAGLQRVGSAWFIKNCNQQAEGEFDRLMTAARGFSDRRNEFAHGLVMDVSGFIVWRLQMRLASPTTPRFIVMPALHDLRKHDTLGMPTFGYSSRELQMLYERLLDLEVEIALFMNRLWPGWLER